VELVRLAGNHILSVSPNIPLHKLLGTKLKIDLTREEIRLARSTPNDLAQTKDFT